jgi:YebC/PmpR family DNA-binding regulatory protein
MSGHSKWATIKRQKAATDAKRGAVFTKLAKVISLAAREKGADPAANFGLRLAIDRAKAANMPKENIERAIKRGTGELIGDKIEELIYEGFGPAKSQFIIKCLSDNKNRTAAKIRHLLAKHSGSLGSVSWNFEQLGVIRIMAEELKNKNLTDQNFELEIIDAGAEDIVKEKEGLTIYGKIDQLPELKKLVEDKQVKAESAEIEYVAKEKLDLAQADQGKVEQLIEELEDDEDVSDYYTNVNL